MNENDVLEPDRRDLPYQPPGEGIRIIGTMFAAIGLLLCWIPFAGYLGLVGILLALGAHAWAEGHPARGRYPTVTVILGLIATTVALAWTLAYLFFVKNSCPHDHDSPDAVKGVDQAQLVRVASLPTSEGRIALVGEQRAVDSCRCALNPPLVFLPEGINDRG